MVNTRKSSLRPPGKAASAAAGAGSHFISSRTRSSKRGTKTEAAGLEETAAARKDEGSDGSLSDSHVSPPAKRTSKHADPVCKDKSKSRSAGQREEWSISAGQSRLTSPPGATLPNGRSLFYNLLNNYFINFHFVDLGISVTDHNYRYTKLLDGKEFCVSTILRLFFLANCCFYFSTAEAVLQEMDNINIRRNRRSGEVERLRMWTDTEFENMDMYSRVKRRRKSLRRNSYGIQNHHEVSTEGEEEGMDCTGSTAEAVLQEMDNINIRRNRRSGEVERLRMWTDTEFENMDMYSRVKRRRKSLRRNSYGIQNHHEVSTEGEEEESQEEDGDIEAEEAEGEENDRPYNLRQRKTVERYQAPPIVPAHQKKRENTLFDIHRSPARRSHIRCLPLNFRAEDLASGILRERVKVGASLADVDPMIVDKSVRFDSVGGLSHHILALKEMVVFPLLYPEIFEKFKIQPPSSIVSTLLALMDGLDNRGEIVVIGATNRLDSIDPALRRPGRFDREFLFNLPDQKARKHILQIHTRDWNPKLSDPFLGELAEKCVGYCGADIKALCTEAALIALRRRYPQIYVSSQKLQLDVSSVVLSAQDFYHAMQNIVPASQRAVTSSGHALSPVIRPLLERTFATLLEVLHKVFPHAEFSQSDKSEDVPSLILDDSEDENASSIFETSCPSGSPKKQSSAAIHKPYLHFTMSAYHQPTSYRPRLLLTGERGSGQTSHLAPALLHTLEKFSVHRLDLPALYSVSAKTPEESCAQIFREARRTVPSIVYMPQIGDWWEAVSETVRATFLTLLQDIPSFSPIFLLSTSESMYSELPEEVKCIFRIQYEEVFYIQKPTEEDRLRFFKGLILDEAAMPPPRRKQAGKLTYSSALRAMEVLPLALPSPARELSEAEKQRMEDQEENTLRELRLFLRDVTKRLATDKRFNIFSKPVDIEEVSDYLEVIKEPMDLSTIITKIDKHNYLTAKDFLTDIDLICSNALEYNPDKDPGDKIIRHRACTLKDTAHAIIAAELDPEFNKMCEEIKEARRKRGLSVTAEQINPHGSAVRKTEARVEETFRNKQKPTMTVWPNSATKCAFRIRRKSRRRSQWGKGIIKKRKVNNLKKDEDDAKFADDENHGEDSKLLENGELEISTDCIEENGEEIGDLSMTNDESSCDIMDIDAEQRLNNGTSGKENNFASTEEESSNESLLITDSVTLNAEKGLRKDSTLKGDCVNGETSGHSLEGVPVPACHNGKMESVDAASTSDNSSGSIDKKKSSEDQPKEKTDACSENQGDDLVKAEVPHCSNNEKALQSTDLETKDAEADKEGMFKSKKTRKVTVEQSKLTSLEHVPEEPSDPLPSVVVDHDRLKKLLNLVVKKSDNLTVDQLERLYSLLSQCIYRHRRDYDKSQLIEVMFYSSFYPFDFCGTCFPRTANLRLYCCTSTEEL
ncbi:hypothetical protein ASZ78_016321 [Callipepla squamata]|uniref:Bromo domain-containing protein n=1 Tax=Callipepla squamata TaxID=9009 RepID=A0A226MTX1_CALSU|nr:hypothetical protein ASZ78_016321 [Callipepla squamata]